MEVVRATLNQKVFGGESGGGEKKKKKYISEKRQKLWSEEILGKPPGEIML